MRKGSAFPLHQIRVVHKGYYLNSALATSLMSELKTNQSNLRDIYYRHSSTRVLEMFITA